MDYENCLVDLLPPSTKKALQSRFESVDLKAGDLLYEQGDPIQEVYFPRTAVASLLSVMSDGRAVEVATIGSEGFLGLPFLVEGPAVCRVIVQVSGEMLRMRVDAFRQALSRHIEFPRVVYRWGATLLGQIARSAGCNRLHSLEERCARWLLTTQDRARADELALTQDVVAEVLGTRR